MVAESSVNTYRQYKGCKEQWEYIESMCDVQKMIVGRGVVIYLWTDGGTKIEINMR